MLNVEACGLPLPRGEIKNLVLTDDGYGRLCIMITPLSFSGEQVTVPGSERHCEMGEGLKTSIRACFQGQW